jgi:hypothetical protein
MRSADAVRNRDPAARATTQPEVKIIYALVKSEHGVFCRRAALSRINRLLFCAWASSQGSVWRDWPEVRFRA